MGKREEANATIKNVRIGFSVPCKEFAYYGDEDLFFYSSNLPGNDANQIEKETVARFPFTSKSDVIQRFLLLFLKGNLSTGLKYKIHAIPFTLSEIPFGSLKFFSQFPETLYLSLNKKTMTLPSGGAKVLILEHDEIPKFYPLEGYLRKEGKYEKVLSQSLSLSNDLRGFLFFTSVRERPRFKPYLLTRQPLTRAIGYGVPSLVEPETNPKEEIKAKYPLGLENATQTLQPIVQ